MAGLEQLRVDHAILVQSSDRADTGAKSQSGKWQTKDVGLEKIARSCGHFAATYLNAYASPRGKSTVITVHHGINDYPGHTGISRSRISFSGKVRQQEGTPTTSRRFNTFRQTA